MFEYLRFRWSLLHFYLFVQFCRLSGRQFALLDPTLGFFSVQELIEFAEKEVFPIAEDLHIVSVPQSRSICFYQTPYFFCISLILAADELRHCVKVRMQRPQGEEVFPWKTFFGSIPKEDEIVERTFTSAEIRHLLAQWRQGPFPFWLDGNLVIRDHWCAWWLLRYLTQAADEEPATQDAVRSSFSRHGKLFLSQQGSAALIGRESVFVNALEEEGELELDPERIERVVTIRVIRYLF